MLVSYNWLKDYVHIDDITPEQLAEKLTRSGVEVDIVQPLNKGVKNIVVGYVKQCEKHPEADRLSVCIVDIGEEEDVQIVCGAPNVAAGQYVVVAKVGARLPGGMKIKRAKLRGQVSEGMICSLQELGFEGKVVPKEMSNGIFHFPTEMEPGTDAIRVLGLDDYVLDLDLTANRSDCLSMIGVAYEVAAILGREVKLPEVAKNEEPNEVKDIVTVTVEAEEDNPYYGAFLIKDVTIAPSPMWLQTKLMASGIRPINNVVDVTNYILLEYGQPLHSFDYDRFGSNEVLIRRAKDGEVLETLDNVERTLKSDHLVITNGSEPVALAGVMGGASSEVQNDTKNILLEAAYFKGETVRIASRDLGLRSDASARFEKGVDPSRVKEAGWRAATLIAELAGGTVVPGVAEFDVLSKEEQKITVTLDDMNRLLGTAITVEEVKEILQRLQFSFTEDNGTFVVTAPTRRQDIKIKEDIIEEVARLYGYDNIPTTYPIFAATPGGLTEVQKQKRKARRFLESVGMSEAITYSLTSVDKEAYFVEEDRKRVKVAHPMSEERSVLRTTLIPHLLDALSHNKNRHILNVHLYELGSVFLTEEEVVTTLPNEETYLSGALMGMWHEHDWQQEKKETDFFVIKGVVEGLLHELNVDGNIQYFQTVKKGFHPGRTATLEINGEQVGVLGQLHPTVAKEWSLSNVYVFELSFDRLMEFVNKDLRYEPIPRYPAISRDIALVIDKEINADEVKRNIIDLGGELLKVVELFDLYEGEHLPEGKKSLAFSLLYQDVERTLTDEEVNDVHAKIVEGLEERLGAKLRE